MVGGDRELCRWIGGSKEVKTRSGRQTSEGREFVGDRMTSQSRELQQMS